MRKQPFIACLSVLLCLSLFLSYNMSSVVAALPSEFTIDANGDLILNGESILPNDSPSGITGGGFMASAVQAGIFPANTDDGIIPRSTTQITNYCFPDANYYTKIDLAEVNLSDKSSIVIRLYVNYAGVDSTDLWFYNTANESTFSSPTVSIANVVTNRWIDVTIPSELFKNEDGKITGMGFAMGVKPISWGNVQFDSMRFVKSLVETDADGNTLLRSKAILPNDSPSGITGGGFMASAVQAGIFPANTDDGIIPRSTTQITNYCFPDANYYTKIDLAEVDLSDKSSIVIRLYVNYAGVDSTDLWFYNTANESTFSSPTVSIANVVTNRWIDVTIPSELFKNVDGKITGMGFAMGVKPISWGNVQFDSMRFVKSLVETDADGNMILRNTAIIPNTTPTGISGAGFMASTIQNWLLPANTDDGLAPRSTTQITNYCFPDANYFTKIDFAEVDLTNKNTISMRLNVGYANVASTDLWFYNTANECAFASPTYSVSGVITNKWIDVTLPASLFVNADGKITGMGLAMGVKPISWGNIQIDSIKLLTTPIETLDEFQLTNMNPDNVTVLLGSDLNDIRPWGIDKNSYSGTGLVASGYPAANESDGLGADGNVFVRTFGNGWSYPAMMLKLNKKVKASESGKLVFRMYIDVMDSDTELWFCPYSLLTPDLTSYRYSVSDLGMGKWIDVEVDGRSFADDTGYINYITILLYQKHAYGNPDNGAGNLYLDNINFSLVDRAISDSFTSSDISDIIPMTSEGITKTAENDNWEELKNIVYAKTDYETPSNVIKMKVKVSNMGQSNGTDAVFNMYTTVMSNGMYYNQGGLFYWISDKAANIGTSKDGKTVIFANESLDEGLIGNDEEFDLEYGAVPFFVNQGFAGYHVYIKINGLVVCEGFADLLDIGETGNIIGTFIHATASGTIINIKPLTMSTELTLANATTVNLDARYDQLAINETTRLTVDVKGIYLPQTISDVEILSGSEFGHMEDGYLVADNDGLIKLKVTVTNPYGTYDSNIVEVRVGEVSESVTGNSSDVNSQNEATTDIPDTSDLNVIFLAIPMILALTYLITFKRKKIKI